MLIGRCFMTWNAHPHTHRHTSTAEQVRCNGSVYAISAEQTPGSFSAFIALVLVTLWDGWNKRGGIKMQFKFWKTFQRKRSGKFKWSRLFNPSLLWNISSWLHSGGGPLIKWLQKRSNTTQDYAVRAAQTWNVLMTKTEKHCSVLIIHTCGYPSFQYTRYIFPDEKENVENVPSCHVKNTINVWLPSLSLSKHRIIGKYNIINYEL